LVGKKGARHYYQLTPKGAAVVNVSPNKANPKISGFDRELGALFFSCMSELPRKRLKDAELNTLFGAPKGGNVIHVAQADDETTVFRLFVPEPDTGLDRYIVTLKRSAYQACKDEKILRWIERGTYQFAVLVTNEERKARLTDLVRASDFPDLRVRIEIAPSGRDLPQFFPPDREESLF
jgi:hypothetical protein